MGQGPLQELPSTVSFFANRVNMSLKGEFAIQNDTEVFGRIDSIKAMVVNFVVFIDDVPFPFSGYGQYLAFLSRKFHGPLPFPGLKLQQVILYEIRVSIRVYDSVQNAVVDEESDTAHQPVG